MQEYPLLLDHMRNDCVDLLWIFDCGFNDRTDISLPNRGTANQPFPFGIIIQNWETQLLEWEVTRRTPSDALLREACPPTAQPHRRPAEGNSDKSPPFWDYMRLRLSVPHHLITLRSTPSHQVVRLQSRFPWYAYVGLVQEYTSYDVNTPSDDFDDDLFPKNRHGTVQDKEIFGASRHQAQRPTIRTRRRLEPSAPSPSREQRSTFFFFELSNNSSAYSMPFPASRTTSEDNEGKAHATGHSMGFG